MRGAGVRGGGVEDRRAGADMRSPGSEGKGIKMAPGQTQLGEMSTVDSKDASLTELSVTMGDHGDCRRHELMRQSD